MEQQKLDTLIRDLSSDEQAAVRDFILFLKRKPTRSSETPFLAAVDEFIGEHPDLLRRLAQ